MICSACRNPLSFSSNPFIWLFVHRDSWYFCLGNIFNCSEENEKTEQSPNCVTITVGNKGSQYKHLIHCASVFVTVLFGSDIAQTPREDAGGPQCNVLCGDSSQRRQPGQLSVDARPHSICRSLKPSLLWKFIELKSWEMFYHVNGSGEGGMEHHFSPFHFQFCPFRA